MTLRFLRSALIFWLNTIPYLIFSQKCVCFGARAVLSIQKNDLLFVEMCML